MAWSGGRSHALTKATSRPLRPGRGRRDRRVLVVLAGVVCLSLGDLLVTVTHLETIGLLEVNPIARRLVETTASTWALSAYKLLTLAVAVGILVPLRRRLLVEIAAWCELTLLVLTALAWSSYCDTLDDEGELKIPEYGWITAR